MDLRKPNDPPRCLPNSIGLCNICFLDMLIKKAQLSQVSSFLFAKSNSSIILSAKYLSHALTSCSKCFFLLLLLFLWAELFTYIHDTNALYALKEKCCFF